MSRRSTHGLRDGLWPRARRLATMAATAIALLCVAPAAASASCDAIASPSGDDSAAGNEAAPFRTAQKLADSLSAGQTGCLRAGTYSGNVKLTRGGAAGAPVTLTSYPGERATVAGKMWITEGADFVTVSSLDLDGRNAGGLPSPAVNGDDVTFTSNDVTNHHSGICFDLGATTYGRAYRTTIADNRIHDCGSLPQTNRDHGIYVEHATAARIVDNLIYDNADRGVQLYPDAQSSYIARNVIDGNGEGVLVAGGAEDYGPQASSDNVVEHNLITNSTTRNNVEWHWGAGIVGERNVVRQNCIFGGANAANNQGLAPEQGYSAHDNLLADPGYLNRGGKDFGLRGDSPCRNLASYRTPASRLAAGQAIVLDAPRAPLKPGRSTTLTGRVTGPKRPRHVVLRTRHGKRWKQIGKARVRRDGRFRTRVRLRKSRAHGARRGGKLILRKVRLSSATHALSLRASGSGVGSSNTVRVRVRG
jgi:hypothetical protein